MIFAHWKLIERRASSAVKVPLSKAVTAASGAVQLILVQVCRSTGNLPA